MLAVSLIRLLPTQSYDNWINLALILFLLNIIIIILVILTKFSSQNIKSPNIIRPHFSTSQKNLMLWTMSTMIIWQTPGGPRPHLNRKAQISQNWKMIRGHRSHRKPTYYWDQIVRPPFWGHVTYAARQWTPKSPFNLHQSSPVSNIFLAYFMSRFQQKVRNRRVGNKKLTERFTKSGHNFHVNIFLENLGYSNI